MKIIDRILTRGILKENGCIEWPLERNDYVVISYNGKTTRATRIIAHFYLNLDLSNHKLFVCHTCDNKKCINPKSFIFRYK